MNKRIVCYNYARDRVILNGTTTIAYGNAWANTNNKFGLDASKLIGSLIWLSKAKWAGKGIAKLSPDDTYDELSGRIVASKKSEKMAIKLALGDLGNQACPWGPIEGSEEPQCSQRGNPR